MSTQPRITFPRSKVSELAKKIGATVSWSENSWFEVRVDAPIGKHFGDGLHQLVSATRRNATARDRSDCFVDILERMQELRLEECDPLTNQDCADIAESASISE